MNAVEIEETVRKLELAKLDIALSGDSARLKPKADKTIKQVCGYLKP